MANNFEINLPSTAFVIPSSGGCSRGVVQSRPCLLFDDAAVECAHSIQFQLPATYTGSGTLKLDVAYSMVSATSGNVDFDAYIEAVTPGDATDLDATTSYDTANGGSGAVPATAGYEQKITITLTSKDSCAAGDYIRIKLERDADDGVNDTAGGDARVWYVTLREEA